MTAVELPAPAPRFVLRGVSWAMYQQLRDVPEMYDVRMTFDEGDLEMMSPSSLHERFSRLIDRLIDVSRSSARKLALYAAFGVPEVWRYDGQQFEIYVLGPEQRYFARAASVCLPGFPLDEAARILGRLNVESERALVGSFREFIRRKG